MAEVLFILITVYVVYVVQSVVLGDYKKKAKPVEVKQKPKPKEVDTKTTKTAITKTVAKKTTTVKKTVVSNRLRNPETQEVTKVATSYRMTKRWIKDALVTEGLLDKVYKTNELDAAAKATIGEALAKLAKIKKYQA